MATHDRTTSRKGNDTAAGTDGFIGQVGLFETANGLPHGPVAVVLAIAVALVVIPLTRLARMIARR